MGYDIVKMRDGTFATTPDTDEENDCCIMSPITCSQASLLSIETLLSLEEELSTTHCTEQNNQHTNKKTISNVANNANKPATPTTTLRRRRRRTLSQREPSNNNSNSVWRQSNKSSIDQRSLSQTSSLSYYNTNCSFTHGGGIRSKRMSKLHETTGRSVSSKSWLDSFESKCSKKYDVYNNSPKSNRRKQLLSSLSQVNRVNSSRTLDNCATTKMSRRLSTSVSTQIHQIRRNSLAATATGDKKVRWLNMELDLMRDSSIKIVDGWINPVFLSTTVDATNDNGIFSLWNTDNIHTNLEPILEEKSKTKFNNIQAKKERHPLQNKYITFI